MIFQECLRYCDYNLPLAVQEYNYGYGSIQSVLETTSNQTGVDRSEVEKFTNLDWMQFRDVIRGGDKKYLEHVFQYVPDGSILKFKTPNRLIRLKLI